AENPLYPLANIERKSKRMSFIGNVNASWDILKGLTANAKYAYFYFGTLNFGQMLYNLYL
ncbi:MAG: hypothetical protein K8S16_11755, partial [Bacteroidales bacterium]|nr:hypothetical protein [Bacteroidales bacterium]